MQRITERGLRKCVALCDFERPVTDHYHTPVKTTYFVEGSAYDLGFLSAQLTASDAE